MTTKPLKVRKGVFSKPSGNPIVATNFCLSSLNRKKNPDHQIGYLRLENVKNQVRIDRGIGCFIFLLKRIHWSKKFCTMIPFSKNESWCPLWLGWKGLVWMIPFSNNEDRTEQFTQWIDFSVSTSNVSCLLLFFSNFV